MRGNRGMPDFASFRFRRFDAALGAEILDIDLSRPVSDETVAEIRRALLESNGLLVFPSQHITPDELAHCFSKGTATKDGFANRFLWPLVKRSKSLPHGGNRSVLEPLINPLAEALATARR